MKHLGTKTGGPHHVINSRRGASPFLHSVIGGELQYHSQTTINLSLSLCLFVYHFPQDSPRCLCPTVCGTTNCTSNCTKSCSNACVFFFAVCRAPNSAVRALVIFLCVLWKWQKYAKTQNERFCIVFLIGAWVRIWPQPGQPPKPRSNHKACHIGT